MTDQDETEYILSPPADANSVQTALYQWLAAVVAVYGNVVVPDSIMDLPAGELTVKVLSDRTVFSVIGGPLPAAVLEAADAIDAAGVGSPFLALSTELSMPVLDWIVGETRRSTGGMVTVYASQSHAMVISFTAFSGVDPDLKELAMAQLVTCPDLAADRSIVAGVHPDGRLEVWSYHSDGPS